MVGGKRSFRNATQASGSAVAMTLGLVAPAGAPGEQVLQLLAEEGIGYRVLRGGESGPTALNPGDADAVLLDLTEVGMEGAGALMERLPWEGLPVLAVLAPQQLAHMEIGEGIVDFIICPSVPGELTSRVRHATSQRRVAPVDKPGVIRVGDLVMDTNSYDVFVAGKSALLTFKEYEMLKLLASNPGRVFSREALLEQVWGYEYFGGTRTVDVHIRRLRSKIEDTTHTFIDTIWSVGYRCRAD
jgi:DNA-binding response OmpR family regulator